MKLYDETGSSCPFCGRMNENGVKFCGGCGKVLSYSIADSTPSQSKCPFCGATNASGNSFCNTCGKPMNGYVTRNYIPVSTTTISPSDGFSKFLMTLFTYPGTWVGLATFIMMFVFAFGGFLNVDFYFVSESVTSFEMTDIMELVEDFPGTDTVGWVKVFMVINNIGVIAGLVCGVIQLLGLLSVYNRSYTAFENIGAIGQWAFGIGRVLTLIVSIACWSQFDGYVSICWQFWASIVSFVVFIIANANVVSTLYSSTYNIEKKREEKDEWVCAMCGRKNPGMFVRCECGFQKY